MRAEVGEQPASRPRLFAPARLDRGAQPLPARLVELHYAQRALVEQSSDGQEIPIPAAVVEQAERAPQVGPKPGDHTTLDGLERVRFDTNRTSVMSGKGVYKRVK